MEPASEESKPLTPFTCYHPFQSSFDSEFGKNPSLDKTAQHNSMRIPGKSGGRQIFGGGNVKYSNEPTSNSRFYGPREPAKIPDFMGSPTSVGLMTGTTGDCWVPMSRSSQIQGNPMWFYPGLFVPEGTGLRHQQQQQQPPHHSHASANGNRIYNVENTKHIFGKSDCGQGKNLSASKTSFVPDVVHKTPTNSVRAVTTTRNDFKDVHKSAHNRPMICNFCKNNKEVPDIYLNHYLYDPKTKKLTCPVLRKHVCEICGETGDRAHTLQYCPVNRQKGLQAKIPVLLKTRTITNSTGKIRRN
ncbi:hypothetical protein RUM44_003892 [Polyplax serrata]|uniref:Nanos-type domain-containing protein n=1 Tax=Polyplax serrata TaxID=468196 RepID=A0ABR1B1A7_POLSC